MDKYEILKNVISHSNKIVFFTGAGISVPSGIPDFRSSNGLYNQKDKTGFSPEEIISHSFYKRYTKEFFQFYKDKMMFLNAQPNLAHQYIANLEKNKDVTVVTQNIDGLHSLAGSKNVIELHGSIHRNYCEKCNKFYDASFMKQAKEIPTCNCGGIIKPDVILYEEPLNEEAIRNAIEAISKCDTLIIIGTSLVVYPAASFIRYFSGHCLVVINKDKTSYDENCDLMFNEDIIEVIKKI